MNWIHSVTTAFESFRLVFHFIQIQTNFQPSLNVCLSFDLCRYVFYVILTEIPYILFWFMLINKKNNLNNRKTKLNFASSQV